VFLNFQKRARDEPGCQDPAVLRKRAATTQISRLVGLEFYTNLQTEMLNYKINNQVERQANVSSTVKV
jgi:hypothetical protein